MAAPAQGGLSKTLILTVFMICLGSSSMMGYHLGVLNNIMQYVRCFVGQHWPNLDFDCTKSYETNDPAALPLGIVNAIFVIGGAIGAFGSGLIADKFGRRNGLLINNVIGIIGAIICSLSTLTDSITVFSVGRFVNGLNAGVVIGIASLYLTEISPCHLRGLIGACHQLAVTMGIMVSYLATLSFMPYCSAKLWPVAVGLSIFPYAVSLCALPFFPESPRFLFMTKHREDDARVAYKRFNPNADVDTFIGEMREELEVMKSQPKFKFTTLFTQKDLRMPLIIACLIQGMQQLSGINAVINYSSMMFATAQVPSHLIQYMVLGIGVVNVIMTVVALPLLERAGRRTLLLWPTVGLALCLLLLAITVPLTTSFTKNNNETASMVLACISIILIFGYIIGFAMGLGPVPGLIVSEIFRQEPRAAAYSISQFLQWMCNLLVLLIFPYMDASIGGFSFLPFLAIVSGCWVFFFFFMPETRGRSFDEVARDLAFGNIVVGKRTARLEDQNMTVFSKDRAANQSNADPSVHTLLVNKRGNTVAHNVDEEIA